MFECFCSRLLEQGQHSDVKFLVHGQTFLAHRCVLSARSEYFTEMFETKWKGKNLITLKHPLVDKYLHICFVIAFCHVIHMVSACIKSVLISDQSCSLWSHPAIFLHRFVCFIYGTKLNQRQLIRNSLMYVY